MTPLTETEIKWAKASGLLEKEDGYFETLLSNPRKAFRCIAGACFIFAVIFAMIFIAGVM